MRRVISLITLVSAASLVSLVGLGPFGCYRGANSGKAGTGTHQQTTVTSDTVRSDTQPGPSHVIPSDRGAGHEGHPPAGGDTWGTGTPTGASASDFDNTGAGAPAYGTATMGGGDGGKVEMGGGGGKKIAPEMMGGDGGHKH